MAPRTPRLRRFFAAIPLGLASVCLLLGMALTWVAWPEPPPDEVSPTWRAALQLALDRFQIRLSGDQVAEAARGRSAVDPAYQGVAQQMEMLTRHLPSPPDAVRLWVPEHLFTQETRAWPADALVLLYESAAQGETTLKPGSRLPPRSELLGASWYTSDTAVDVLPQSTAECWRVRATTTLVDAKGRTMGLAEVRLTSPRTAPFPLWPRTASVALLAALLVALWEAGLAPLRRGLVRLTGWSISTATLHAAPEPSDSELQAWARIDYLASRAEGEDKLWPILPAPAPLPFEVSTFSRSRAANSKLPTPEAVASLSATRFGAGAAPPGSPGGEAPALASLVIEDENLLRRLVEALAPHLQAKSFAEQQATVGMNDLSVRLTIEIRRRNDAVTKNIEQSQQHPQNKA